MKNIFGKIKGQLDSYQSGSQQQHQQAPPIPGNKPKVPAANGRLKWPPKIETYELLGEVKDTNGRNIPRDLGRSVRLGGHWYYMFADTFCFDDKGEFCGLQNNTIAYIPDINNPTKCTYLSKQPLVPHFIPYTKDEVKINDNPENKKKNSRIVNWAFGGIIPDDQNGDSNKGWTMSDVTELNGRGGIGVCPVRVTVDNGHQIRAERVSGPMANTSEGQPRWGNISNIVHGEWVYLLSGFKLTNFLARVKHNSDWHDKSNWEYLVKKNDRSWAKNFSNTDELQPLLKDQGQGALFYVENHGPKGKPWMWIGVNKWADSKMWAAAAERIEGPWDIQFMMELPKFWGDKSNRRYCLYPHLWASDLSRGEIVLSWSDDGQMGGKVIVGKMKFATEDMEG